MTTPRLEIRLADLAHNTRTLVDRLGERGIEVCAVTKATLGSAPIARVLLDAGATSLGESRIENVESLRRGGIGAPITMIRGPLLSQVDRVVDGATSSLNSEPAVIEALATAAVRRGVVHQVVVMLELGDLREGILVSDLAEVVRRIAVLPSVRLVGVGTNLACQHGVIPDRANMAALADAAGAVARQIGGSLPIVSGGNSANLRWALDPNEDVSGISHLRLGESILLGRDPTDRRPIDGLRTDAFTLVGEVIESRAKPSTPWGRQGQAAFTSDDVSVPDESPDTGRHRVRTLVAVGRQDVDPAGLSPPPGLRLVGASSDHLVLEAVGDSAPEVGDELRFGVDYAALVRAMSSPFVERCLDAAGLDPTPAPTG